MTNQEILEIAMQQSAWDSGCSPKDFQRAENTVVLSRPDPRARKYLELPFSLDLTSYGNCIVCSVSEDLRETAEKYIGRYSAAHCFETPNLIVLQGELKKFDLNICFMAEYFLPDPALLKPLPCEYELRFLTPGDFADCYTPQWSNALCEKRRHLDVLAVAAFDRGQMIGMAGCSADCEAMWQIGIDVLPKYRRRGVASALTSALALEILNRGRVPFYCSAWSNVKSVRNALRSGFKPAWVQMTAKKNDFINELNR